MAYLRIALFASIGILIAIAAVPQTGWIFRNDLGTLVGKSVDDHYYGCLDPKNWPDESSDQQLSRAMAFDQARNPSDWPPSRLFANLEKFCRNNPNNATAWAHLLRLALQMPLHSPSELKRIKFKPEDLVRRARYVEMIRLAIEHGERLEPNNPYYTMIRACLLESESRHPEAQAAIKEASIKTEFNDHALDEALMESRAAKEYCGYRGAGMEIMSYAGVIYPQTLPLREVLPLIPLEDHGKPKPDVQIAALRAMYTAAKTSNAAIVVIVLKGAFNQVLLGRTTRHKAEPTELINAASALDRATKSAEAETMLSAFEKVDFSKIANADPDSEDIFIRGLAAPVMTSSILIGILLCVPVILLAARFGEWKLSRTRNPDPLKLRPWAWYLCSAILCISFTGLVYSLYKSHYPYSAVTSGEGTAQGYGAYEALAFLWGSLLGVAFLFVPRRRPRPGVAVILAVTLLSLGYLLTVVQTLRTDVQLKGALAKMGHEAEQIRGNW